MAGVNVVDGPVDGNHGPPPYNAPEVDIGLPALPSGPAVAGPRLHGPPRIARQGHGYPRGPVPATAGGRGQAVGGQGIGGLNARKSTQTKPLRLGRQGKICYIPDRSMLWFPSEMPTPEAEQARFEMRHGDCKKLMAFCDARNYVRYCASIRKEMTPAEVKASVLRAFDGTGTPREKLAGGFSWAEIVDSPATFIFRAKNTQGDGQLIASLASTPQPCIFIFPHQDDHAFRARLFERLDRKDTLHASTPERSEEESGEEDPRGEKGKDFEECIICKGKFLYKDFAAHSERCLEQEDQRLALEMAEQEKKDKDMEQRRHLQWTKRSIQARRHGEDEPFSSVFEILDRPAGEERALEGNTLLSGRSGRLQSAAPPTSHLLSDSDSDILPMPVAPSGKPTRGKRGVSLPIEARGRQDTRDPKRRKVAKVNIEADPLPPSTIGKKLRTTRTAEAARRAAYELQEERDLLREMETRPGSSRQQAIRDLVYED